MKSTNLDELKKYAAQNDWRAAMRIAAKFPRLGAEKAAITRAWEAMNRPDFYRQIGRNPDDLIDAGIAALRQKYGI